MQSLTRTHPLSCLHTGTSRGEVTGILGNDTTLEFKFNISVTEYFAVYTTNHTKIAEYSKGKISSSGGDFDVNPKNTSVFFTITNLKLNHSRIYWVSLFTDSGLIIESKKVQLIVREENRSSTGKIRLYYYSNYIMIRIQEVTPI